MTWADLVTPGAATQVEPLLWVGNVRDGTDFEWLRSKRIACIVNLTGADVGQAHAGFDTLIVQQLDCTAIPPDTLRTFFQWMVGHSWELPTLIHCAAGISRATSFTIAWLMYRERHFTQTGSAEASGNWWTVSARWNFYEDRLRQLRPWIRPHVTLKNSILDYFHAEIP